MNFFAEEVIRFVIDPKQKHSITHFFFFVYATCGFFFFFYSLISFRHTKIKNSKNKTFQCLINVYLIKRMKLLGSLSRLQ